MTKEFYINDAGAQIDKFGRSLSARYIQLLKGENAIEFPEDGYQGDDIRVHAQNYIDKFGDTLLSKSEEERKEALVSYALPLNIAALKKTLAEYGIDEEELSRRKKISGTTLALVIIGSPLWIPLAIAALAIVLAVAISILAVIISIASACIGITLSSPFFLVMGIITAFSDVGTGLIAIGYGLSAAALGILAATGIYKLIAYIVKKIKEIIIRNKGSKL